MPGAFGLQLCRAHSHQYALTTFYRVMRRMEKFQVTRKRPWPSRLATLPVPCKVSDVAQAGEFRLDNCSPGRLAGADESKTGFLA